MQMTQPLNLLKAIGTCVLGVSVMTAPAVAGTEANCHRLEALAVQYAGVALTPNQQTLKRKLVAWYGRNCHGQAGAG
jgi:hypothetical protein